jgi:hypothetical protein
MIGIVADSRARYPLFMKFSALILAPLLLGPASAAATPDPTASVETEAKKRKRRANPKKEAKELELLQRSATLYWEGVRWNDTEKSAKFIEDANDRMEFSQWLEAKLDGQQVMDAKVIRVDVKVIENKKAAITKIAHISVAMQAYTVPEQVLKKETFHQRWYRNGGGWWLEWKSPTVQAREAEIGTSQTDDSSESGS